MKFTNAIVRLPGEEMIKGLTSARLGPPDYSLAVQQHQNYIEALMHCGLRVKVLEAEPLFPDATFIEDVALCTPHCAIITNPGASSRKGETNRIKDILKDYFDAIEIINEPGTIEAGDIMMVGDHYYIGISERTNRAGAEQMITLLAKYGLTGSTIALKEVLHLKTGLSYLENNNLLISGEFIENPAFTDFRKIIIEPYEAYAVNSLWINDKVLVPEGFPKTAVKIKQAGYQVIPVAVSEFQKLDGGLSCLSLRF